MIASPLLLMKHNTVLEDASLIQSVNVVNGHQRFQGRTMISSFLSTAKFAEKRRFILGLAPVQDSHQIVLNFKGTPSADQVGFLSLLEENLRHHALIFMFQQMAMEHRYSFDNWIGEVHNEIDLTAGWDVDRIHPYWVS